MVVCSVPGCAAKGVRFFHSFPKDPGVRKSWVRTTKTFHLTDKQLNSYAKICKYHFHETDFEMNARGQQGLKRGAVPSLNLPSDFLNSAGDYALVSCNEIDQNIASSDIFLLRLLKISTFHISDSAKKM